VPFWQRWRLRPASWLGGLEPLVWPFLSANSGFYAALSAITTTDCENAIVDVNLATVLLP
jgi:hypothetical protein